MKEVQDVRKCTALQTTRQLQDAAAQSL